MFCLNDNIFSPKYSGFLILNYDLHRELCKYSGENMKLAQMTIITL